MKEERERLIKFLDNNATVILSISGGPDSMALLSLVNSIKNEKELNLIVAHVNHKVRKESDEEALMVEKYVKDLGLTFELYEIDKYHEKVNFHEDARKIRYKFIKELVVKHNAKYIMTAHHGDDLMETILMRLTRGSSINGYVGFKEISAWEGIELLRPLIRKTKKELEEYDKNNNIPYAIDKTNFLDDYTRNRYRNNIIPLIKEEDKNVNLKYLKFSEEINKYYEYVKNDAEESLHKIVDKDNNIIVSKLLNLPKLQIEVIISELIKKVQLSDYLPVNDNLFEEMLNVINSTKTNVTINLPSGYIFGKEYGKLVFKKTDEKKEDLDIVFDKCYMDEYIIIERTSTYESSNNTIALNTSEIKMPLKLRYRLDGDKMEVLNLKGKRKINDIFIDLKVNKDLRNKYPLLVDNENNILWIPGLKKSKFAKKKNEKYDIIITCKEKKDEK